MPLLTARAGKIKIFFGVDLEAGNSFYIICLSWINPEDRWGKPVKNRAYRLTVITLTSKAERNKHNETYSINCCYAAHNSVSVENIFV